jgi:type II secretory pathway pseudopilin PulG
VRFTTWRQRQALSIKKTSKEERNMSMRVLATQQAETVANQLPAKIQQLRTDITAVQTMGKTLCDPNQWDGPDAVKFRGTWDQDIANLNRLDSALDTLEQQAKQVVLNIRHAGGAT